MTPSRPSGPKGVTYRYLAPERISAQDPPPPAGYTRRHGCAFCGKRGLAHQVTRLQAKLFCDPGCLMLYKKYHILAA